MNKVSIFVASLLVVGCMSCTGKKQEVQKEVAPEAIEQVEEVLELDTLESVADTLLVKEEAQEATLLTPSL